LRLAGANGCGTAAIREQVEAVAPEVTAIVFEQSATIPVASLFTRVGHAPVGP
jgi:hypothetical protein